jgi:hypothetical protein
MAKQPKGELRMRHRSILLATIIASFALSLSTPRTQASDWTGVYARVDKVIFEPNGTAPDRIQIWGAFAIATKDNRNTYDSAQRGYLYYSLKPGKEEVCRKEWADLKAVAGTGQVIGFGGRNQPARVRKAADKPTDPDVYPLDHGVTRMSANRSDYGPVAELLALPKE